MHSVKLQSTDGDFMITGKGKLAQGTKEESSSEILEVILLKQDVDSYQGMGARWQYLKIFGVTGVMLLSKCVIAVIHNFSRLES
jgi:hypothetical protein